MLSCQFKSAAVLHIGIISDAQHFAVNFDSTTYPAGSTAGRSCLLLIQKIQASPEELLHFYATHFQCISGCQQT